MRFAKLALAGLLATSLAAFGISAVAQQPATAPAADQPAAPADAQPAPTDTPTTTIPRRPPKLHLRNLSSFLLPLTPLVVMAEKRVQAAKLTQLAAAMNCSSLPAAGRMTVISGRSTRTSCNAASRSIRKCARSAMA